MKCLRNFKGKPCGMTRRKGKSIIIINVGNIKLEDERQMELGQNLFHWRTSLLAVVSPGR
jgi:hypothetical protein